MSMNIDLSSILTKIANESNFVDASEGKFSKGETLFISGTSAKGDMVTLKDSSGDTYSVSAQELKGYLWIQQKELKNKYALPTAFAVFQKYIK